MKKSDAANMLGIVESTIMKMKEDGKPLYDRSTKTVDPKLVQAILDRKKIKPPVWIHQAGGAW
jgi:hypothetical protein